MPLQVIMNERGRQRYGNEIRQAAESAGISVAEWSPQTAAELRDRLGGWRDAWLVSVYFGHIVGKELLEAVEGRAVNLHPSLLPWCRGAHTNVYPIIERSPAGVTLHVMTPLVDRGPILVQREVQVLSSDTAGSLYTRLEDEGLRLLLEYWPTGVLGAWPGRAQSKGGSEHRVSDLEALSEYDLDSHPEARTFFDLLRARTFPPYRGLRVTIDGRVVEAQVTLRGDDVQ